MKTLFLKIITILAVIIINTTDSCETYAAKRSAEENADAGIGSQFYYPRNGQFPIIAHLLFIEPNKAYKFLF